MMIVDSGLKQRLVDGFIGILQLHVFAYQTDLHRFGSRGFHGQERTPGFQFRRRTHFQSYFAKYDFIHLLALQYERHFVDSRHVDRLDNSLFRYVAKQSHLTQKGACQFMLRT